MYPDQHNNCDQAFFFLYEIWFKLSRILTDCIGFTQEELKDFRETVFGSWQSVDQIWAVVHLIVLSAGPPHLARPPCLDSIFQPTLFSWRLSKVNNREETDMYLFRQYFILILALLAFFWLFYLNTNYNAAYMWNIKQNINMKGLFWYCIQLGIECNIKKVLSFGPNPTVEAWQNNAEMNVWSVKLLF